MQRIVLTLALLAFLGCGAMLWGGVTRIEYFFDTDPGPGGGTQLYSRDPVEVSQLISAASLSPGLHRLFIRGKNDLGKWGLPQSRYFLVPEPFNPVYGTISRLEYFFDTDPGYGNGTPIYTRNLVDVSPLISAAALSPGLHKLMVRGRNTLGKWGLPSARYFLLPSAPPGPHGTISRVEYFFDTDPGNGNGIQIYSRNSVDLTQIVSASALSMGIHRLFVRAKNSGGKWGMPVSRSFLVPPQTPGSFNVTRLEYYVDSDPGFGNGTQVSLTPGTPVSVSVGLPFPGISDGIHKLFVRGRNNQGQWGFPASSVFSNGIPADLILTVSGGTLTLSWTDLPGVDAYTVYSADLPEGPFLPEPSGSLPDNAWIYNGTFPFRFYRVTSTYVEP